VGYLTRPNACMPARVRHAMPPPSRRSHAKTGDITNKKKKKKLLDAFHTFHARRQPSLDSQYRYITSSNSYLFKLRYLKY
jgi:hypothetical protein